MLPLKLPIVNIPCGNYPHGISNGGNFSKGAFVYLPGNLAFNAVWNPQILFPKHGNKQADPAV
jgi:hypothetical protein